MEKVYSVYNPQNSKAAKKIMAMTDTELVKRYIKRKHQKSEGFKKALERCINSTNDEGYYINPALFLMRGNNLNHVAADLKEQASLLDILGYEFRMENVINDLNGLYIEHLTEVNKMKQDSPVQPITEDISKFFTIEALTPALTKLQGNTYGTDVD